MPKLTVTTKFSPGDKVWAEINEQPVELVIKEVDVFVRQSSNIFYVVHGMSSGIHESLCFASKDELTNSLL